MAPIVHAIGRLFLRDDCVNTEQSNTCEKPAESTSGTTWIIVGVVVAFFVIGTGIAVTIFQVRKNKQIALEDQKDGFKMSDYGLPEDTGIGGAGGRGQRRDIGGSPASRGQASEPLDPATSPVPPPARAFPGGRN